MTTLNPISQLSRKVLPSTGSSSEVTTSNLPYGIYVQSGLPNSEINEFVTGAINQVSYVYRKLGGDILDIELSTIDVYACYEEACLEYSYLINLYHSRNIIGDLLGTTTGSFNSSGDILSGSYLSSSLSGGHVSLKYPRMSFGYARKVSDGIASAFGLGGTEPVYSASINLTASVQDYNLQTIVESLATISTNEFYNKVNNKRILIKRVYYRSPRSIWRFYGYYGGLNVLGNLSTYGQFADDTTYQIVPVWQNKGQASLFEDSQLTRLSHYSYEIKNNKIRIFPVPDTWFTNLWIEFTVQKDAWEEDENFSQGIDGVNNLNTIPLANIPYNSINSIGKHWIRRFALACCKEVLAQVRGKFQTLPIPGDSVTLNHADLLNQAKEEKEILRNELKEMLGELGYDKIAERKANEMENVNKIWDKVPKMIYIG